VARGKTWHVAELKGRARPVARGRRLRSSRPLARGSEIQEIVHQRQCVRGQNSNTLSFPSAVPCCSLLFSTALSCSVLAAVLYCSCLFSAALCCSLLLFPVLCCSFLFSGSEFTIGFVQTRGRRKTSKSKKLCIKGNVPGGKTATHFLSRRVARNGKKFLFSAALCCSLLLFPVLCCSFPFSGSEFTIGFVQTRGRRKTSKSKKVCMKGNVPGGTKAMCQGAKQQHTFFPVCCSLLLSAVL
jgi:hypothetical protein